MRKKMQFFLLFFFAVMICSVACKKKEYSKYGIVKGIVTSTIGESQGFKVSLIEANSLQTIQVIVTEENGSFSFSNVAAGTYKIDVQKEGFYYVDNLNNEIHVEANQIIEVNIQMRPNSSYLNGELKITDANGNTISNRITIQKYTPIIALRLYNETTQNISWSLNGNFCQLQGARDTIVGNYHGFTGYDTYPIFSDLSPHSGTIYPGENVLVIGTMNQNIYTLDYFSYKYTTLSLSLSTSRHSYKIELDLPFVNITNMSEWYDH